ncbi:hypothetical protein EK21DRAFT_101569 [Setomelanomma holmii]|uniref:Uncharacterized protein n=1 Tax=Setomelanomma holmii TaxID=210430 RepID=A0A9P4LL37_9PLEO|nr:hypothetical protein EK21DRAFT_101569 [Setomelanomma holmii]
MIVRIPVLVALLPLIQSAFGDVAPEINTVAEGYNVIAKLPCAGCPFLYQDTSHGNNGPWKTREDENALLLNISLPFDSAYLSINNGPLLSTSKSLPRIYASQVLVESSTSEIAKLVETNQIDSPGSAYFGLSYAYSLRRIAKSQALMLRFDVFELWTDLRDPALTLKLEDEKQKVIELVLLQRPVMSSGDSSHAYEIVRTDLIPRSKTNKASTAHIMNFHDWDAHGQIGTPSHLISATSDTLVDYISSGVWSLFVFIMAIIGLFVVLCLFCIFGCGLGKDEYEKAQTGKRRGSKRTGSWAGNDVENAKGRFRSAEELGLRSGGRVVGVGKSD